MKKQILIFAALVIAKVAQAGTCNVRLFRQYAKKCQNGAYSQTLDRSLSELRTNDYTPANSDGGSTPASYHKYWASPDFQVISFQTNDPKACLASGKKLLIECATDNSYVGRGTTLTELTGYQLKPGERAQAIFVKNGEETVMSDATVGGTSEFGVKVTSRQIVLIKNDNLVNGTRWIHFLSSIPE